MEKIKLNINTLKEFKKKHDFNFKVPQPVYSGLSCKFQVEVDQALQDA